MLRKFVHSDPCLQGEENESLRHLAGSRKRKEFAAEVRTPIRVAEIANCQEATVVRWKQHNYNGQQATLDSLIWHKNDLYCKAITFCRYSRALCIVDKCNIEKCFLSIHINTECIYAYRALFSNILHCEKWHSVHAFYGFFLSYET